MKESKITTCSFCGKRGRLIAGPDVYICHICIVKCVGIFLEDAVNIIEDKAKSAGKKKEK